MRHDEGAARLRQAGRHGDSSSPSPARRPPARASGSARCWSTRAAPAARRSATSSSTRPSATRRRSAPGTTWSAIDPRGVARSEPVECLSGKADGRVHPGRPDARRPGRDDATRRGAYKKFAQGCEKRSGKILPHVSTVEAARDMDILRAALGRQEADVRRRVVRHLPRRDVRGAVPQAASAASSSTARWTRPCPRAAIEPRPDRRLRDGFPVLRRGLRQADRLPARHQAVRRRRRRHRLSAFFRTLDAQARPDRRAAARKLGESLATTGVIAAMYDESAWPQLREALTAAMKRRRRGPARPLADSYYERDADGSYANLMYANAAVNCLDLPPAFTAPDAGRARPSPSFEKASPVFGEGLAWASLNCAYWPVKAHRRTPPHRGEGRRPHRRGRHHPRPGDPVPLGPVPGPPALLRPPAHLRRRRPHGVRPRQRLHRHGDQHVPAPTARPRPTARSCS